MTSPSSDSDASEPRVLVSSPAPSSSLAPSSSPAPSSIALISEPKLRSSTNKRTSRVWDYCRFPRDTIVRDSLRRSIWQCKLCQQTYTEAGGLKNVRNHLRTHKIHLETRHEAIIGRNQLGIQEAMTRGSSQSQGYKRRRLDGGDRPTTLDPSVLEDLYITWITAHGVPFKMVEYREFRS